MAMPKMRPRKEGTGYDNSVIARKHLDNKDTHQILVGETAPSGGRPCKQQNRFASVQHPTLLYTPQRLQNRILRAKLGLEQCCPRRICPSCKIQYFSLCGGLCVIFGVWRCAAAGFFIYCLYMRAGCRERGK